MFMSHYWYTKQLQSMPTNVYTTHSEQVSLLLADSRATGGFPGHLRQGLRDNHDNEEEVEAVMSVASTTTWSCPPPLTSQIQVPRAGLRTRLAADGAETWDERKVP